LSDLFELVFCEEYVSVLNVGFECEPGNRDFYANIKGQEEVQNSSGLLCL